MSISEIKAILTALTPRAMGVWRLAADGLTLIYFHTGSLTPQVAAQFADATQKVSMNEAGLGVVLAARNSLPQISVARELPEDSGSGLWLRRFGADLSVAVPILVQNQVVGVVSVAIVESEIDRHEAVSRLVAFAKSPQTIAWIDRERPD